MRFLTLSAGAAGSIATLVMADDTTTTELTTTSTTTTTTTTLTVCSGSSSTTTVSFSSTPPAVTAMTDCTASTQSLFDAGGKPTTTSVWCQCGAAIAGLSTSVTDGTTYSICAVDSTGTTFATTLPSDATANPTGIVSTSTSVTTVNGSASPSSTMSGTATSPSVSGTGTSTFSTNTADATQPTESSGANKIASGLGILGLGAVMAML